jgi:hypothetical protein
LKALLKDGTVIGTGTDEMRIARSLPHGHVAAVLGTLRRIALDRLILSTAQDAASRRYCDLVVAMIADRLIAPRSKLGFVRAVDEETASTTLGAVLRLGKDLSRVDGAFRSLKTINLDIRPICHWTADRVRAHVFLCMLAYHVECTCATRWRRCCSTTQNLPLPGLERSSPVASTQPSDAAKANKATKQASIAKRSGC